MQFRIREKRNVKSSPRIETFEKEEKESEKPRKSAYRDDEEQEDNEDTDQQALFDIKPSTGAIPPGGIHEVSSSTLSRGVLASDLNFGVGYCEIEGGRLIDRPVVR